MTFIQIEAPTMLGAGPNTSNPFIGNPAVRIGANSQLAAIAGQGTPFIPATWIGNPSGPNAMRIRLPESVSPNAGFHFTIAPDRSDLPRFHSAGLFRYPNMEPVDPPRERIIFYDSLGAMVLVPFNTVRSIPRMQRSDLWSGPTANGLSPIVLREGFSDMLPTHTNIAPAGAVSFGFGEVSLRNVMNLMITDIGLRTSGTSAVIALEGLVLSLSAPVIPGLGPATGWSMEVSVHPNTNALSSSLVTLQIDAFSLGAGLNLAAIPALAILRGVVRDAVEDRLTDLEDAITGMLGGVASSFPIAAPGLLPPPRRPVRWSLRASSSVAMGHAVHGPITGILAEIYGVWNAGRGTV